MPAKAGTANPPKKSNAALRKAKDEVARLKSKYSGKMREIRQARVPGALINTTGTILGSLPAGALCGIVPDKYEVMETEIPTGVICEVGCIVTGTAVAGLSAVTEMEYGIHVGGGFIAAGSAMLAKRGASYAKEAAMAWWEGNGNASTPPVSLAA